MYYSSQLEQKLTLVLLVFYKGKVQINVSSLQLMNVLSKFVVQLILAYHADELALHFRINL